MKNIMLSKYYILDEILFLLYFIMKFHYIAHIMKFIRKIFEKL